MQTSGRSLTTEKLEWMTHREASEYLRVSTGTLYNYVYQNKLKVHKFGSKNLYLRKELNEFLLLETKE